MWWPFNIAYTIKEYIVCFDVHLTALTQLKNILFDVMTIWPSLHYSRVYCLMWYLSDLAYTIKEYIVCFDVHLTALTQLKSILFDVMSIWPSLRK